MSEESVLGRVTDPAALDDERGAVAEYETFAPRAWSGRRARLELPKSVRCRACAGGGCDRCERSGAFRLADDPEARSIQLDVPAFTAPRVAVRVPHPFGAASPLKQLIVLVEERGEPDPRLRPEALGDGDLVAREERPAPSSWVWVAGGAAVAAIVAVLRLLLG